MSTILDIDKEIVRMFVTELIPWMNLGMTCKHFSYLLKDRKSLMCLWFEHKSREDEKIKRQYVQLVVDNAKLKYDSFLCQRRSSYIGMMSTGIPIFVIENSKMFNYLKGRRYEFAKLSKIICIKQNQRNQISPFILPEEHQIMTTYVENRYGYLVDICNISGEDPMNEIFEYFYRSCSTNVDVLSLFPAIAAQYSEQTSRLDFKSGFPLTYVLVDFMIGVEPSEIQNLKDDISKYHERVNEIISFQGDSRYKIPRAVHIKL